MYKIYKISGEELIPGELTLKQIERFIFAQGPEQEKLFSAARDIRNRLVGKQCFIRAVIEISNKCSNTCLYCSMSCKNKKIPRFSLIAEELNEAISKVEESGIKTVMLQGGEVKECYNLLLDTLKKTDFNKTEIIGCIGNLNPKQIKELKENNLAGYIIKFETINEKLFFKLRGNTLEKRLKVINDFSSNGINCGTGIILGLPGERDEDIVNSLLFLQELKLPMNSVSPFIPSKDTPLGNQPAASLSTSLNFIALLRLSNPFSLIPSVSALNILDKNGQSKGLNAGANTLTINFTPMKVRSLYNIYNDKSHFTAQPPLRKKGL